LFQHHVPLGSILGLALHPVRSVLQANIVCWARCPDPVPQASTPNKARTTARGFQMATMRLNSVSSHHVRSVLFAATAPTLVCMPLTTGISLPDQGNAKQDSFALATRCGLVRLAPIRLKALAHVQLLCQANTGLLPTTHPELALQVTTKINMQHKTPANRALLDTTVLLQACNLLHVSRARLLPSLEK